VLAISKRRQNETIFRKFTQGISAGQDCEYEYVEKRTRSNQLRADKLATRQLFQQNISKCMTEVRVQVILYDFGSPILLAVLQ
jgi:hypothetical protein